MTDRRRTPTRRGSWETHHRRDYWEREPDERQYDLDGLSCMYLPGAHIGLEDVEDLTLLSGLESTAVEHDHPE